MYLSFNEEYWACDIEGDALWSTVVWCLTAVNVRTGEELVLTDATEIASWVKGVKARRGKFVFHNGLGYDAPTLNRLLGCGMTVKDVIDTLVMSMVYNPSLEGGHSLDEWGKRLRLPKGDFKDFSKLSPEMVEYCLQDSRICKEVFLWLVRALSRLKVPDDALALEHQSWAHVRKQQQDGFYFDAVAANALLATLRQEQEHIRERIHQIWPPQLQLVRTFRRPYNKDGGPTANLSRHREEYEAISVRADAGEYDAFAFVAFNIGSPDQRVEKLLELGWQPLEDEKTPTGKPQATRKGRLVPSLEEFVEDSGEEGPRLIARWIDVNARGNMIETWLNSYNAETGCIHGTLWLANTHRYRHSNPNTANVPGVRVGENGPKLGIDGAWTYEARACWTHRPGRRVNVGVDAKGIQLRVLAQHLKNDNFTKNILSADPHSANQKDFGLPTRSLAKTITYAILMGAGDKRVAAESRLSLKDAKAAKALFFEKVPVGQLIARLQSELRLTGRISLCDKSKVIVTSDHMVIPYLLQGDESKIMKKAMTLIAERCRKANVDAIQVGMIHDELQFDVLEEQVEAFIEIALQAFVDAGLFFGYTVPIEAEAKSGNSWAMTH